MGIFILIQFFKNIINWLRPSFEVSPGISSSRKLTAFWFVVTITICLFKWELTSMVQFYVLSAILLTVLLLFAVITAQDIIKFSKNIKNKPKEEIKEETTIE